jgi:ATP-dependent Clp protease ATP-binding subunit ClpX
MRRKSGLTCSFCGRPASEVARLIAGGDGGVHICDGCIASCNAVLEATPAGTADWATRSEDDLLAALKLSEQTVEATRTVLQAQIDHLRGREVSWARIGDALGTSRQAAWERFS